MLEASFTTLSQAWDRLHAASPAHPEAPIYDHGLYLRTLSEFTAKLLVPYEVDAVLDELAERVTSVLGLLGSGVSLHKGERLEVVTAVDSRIAAVELAQQDSQDGPCVEAARTGRVVSVDDLSIDVDRWPDYQRAARQAGVLAVASLPMRLAGRTVGALNLYSENRRQWSTEDLAAATVMADMATAYLINASEQRRQVELNEQLQHALDARVIIEQAKGMVATRQQISVELAYERIRAHARRRNATVRAVAEAIVRLGLQPAQDAPGDDPTGPQHEA
ncbi:GAF domain-containing protein [Segeticoccus rhizosphaerae]|jgi:GAF domain-containing protein|uniref:GAF domain-containing protein n=1 Tax=Segeticoccus rhizosphaerae TaxID=1104777 RepID=UPI0010BFA87C|nr:GAF and ANTAR domain-containing protein [Ornithinicoccus soli]